ncbi:hypothetical protein [Methylobacter sp.]|uniref:hypothetical protein n=1 Tax=Methylobacter sp. TaxID=2051955 RepID=UPI003DA48A8D
MENFVKFIFIGFTFSISIVTDCTATDFYVDPSVTSTAGDRRGDGSEANPWRTLEEVVKKGLIETKDVNGNVINAGAPIKSGDTIILKSGYHGHVQIKNAYNNDYITVIAGIGQTPQLSELEIISARKWKFSKLTISPVFSNGIIRTSAIVNLGDINYLGGNSLLELTDSYIYSFNENSENLTAEEWKAKAKTGILMGRNATDVHIKNNHISKVDFGINIFSANSSAEGNIVTDFSMDGIRVIANNNNIKNNIIKNNYVINENHSDGIQGFSTSKNELSDISIIGNIILNRDKKEYYYSKGMQGIGFFDGPMKNIIVENNIIMSFTWQGIALYDASQSNVIGNIVFTPQKIQDAASRITLGSKNKGGNFDAYYASNFANKYVFESYNNLIKENNKLIRGDQESENFFMDSLIKRLDDINLEYEKYHPVSHEPRVDERFINIGSSSIF